MTANANSAQNYGNKLYAACSGDPGAVKEVGYNLSGDEDLPVPPPPSARRSAESLGHLKEPWVPAPGRSTRASSGHRYSAAHDQNIHEKCVSNPEMPLTAKSSSSSLFDKSSFSKGKAKKDRGRGRRRSGERSLSGYTLKSKDSLVDITAHLQAKREAVLELWQQNLTNSDPTLLAELENANLLALEAAQDVTKLRAALQDFHNTGKVPSVADTESLQELRLRIHSKLLEFQASQTQIDLTLRENRSRDHTSLPLVKPSSSTEEADRIPAKTSSSSLIYLKEKPTYSSGPETDSETEQEQDDGKSEDYLKSLHEQTDSGSESIDLSKLKRLYAEKYEVAKLPDPKIRSLPDISEVESGTLTEQVQNVDGETPLASTFKNSKNFDDSLGYYRDKIHELYRKLLNQESNFEEMSRAIQRIDSDKEFQIRMLKSNISNQLEDLAPLPELMERSEKRLNEAIVAKFAVESSLQLKVQELNMLKTEIERLQKEIGDTKSTLERSEEKQNILQNKIETLNEENKGLRSDLSVRNDTMIRLEEKLGQAQEPKEINSDRRHMVLEDRILELEHALAIEKKKNMDLKHEKENLAIEMARRDQEMTAEAEKYKMKYRAKTNHLNAVKSSYYDIFSPVYGSAIFPETIKVVTEELSRLGENNAGEDGNE